MTLKVFIDPGHGGTDSGATYGSMYEKDMTLAIGLEMRRVLLEEYDGVEVKMSRDRDVTLSLRQRTDKANAWQADYYVSPHINAGGGTGFESYIYNGRVSNTTKEAQKRIHPVIVDGSGFRDRGLKRANFHVLRETRMSAILTENGFIDTKADREKLADGSFLKKLGRLHAEAVAEAFNLKKKNDTQEEQHDGYFVVQAGAFGKRENAEKKVAQLKKDGHDAFYHFVSKND